MNGEIAREWGIKEKNESSKKASAGQPEKYDMLNLSMWEVLNEQESF